MKAAPSCESLEQLIDCLGVVDLGAGERQHVLQLAEPAADVEPSEDALAGELADDRRRPGHPDGKFVQELAVGKRHLPAWESGQPVGQVVSPPEADVGDLPET